MNTTVTATANTTVTAKAKMRIGLGIILAVGLIAGYYGCGGSSSSGSSAPLYSTGILDATFGTDGVITTTIGGSGSDAYALAQQSDGKILAGGCDFYNGYDNFALCRYTSAGVLDATFGTNGAVSTTFGSSDSAIISLAIQPDGRIVAGGYSLYGGGVICDFALCCYTTAGALDISFGTGGVVTTAVGAGYGRIAALALQTDGKIVAAGYDFNGSNEEFRLARYTVTGTLDSAFGSSGVVTSTISTSGARINGLVIQPDGKIVAAGSAGNISGSNDLSLARYNTNGALDDSFGISGVVTTTVGSSQINAIALQPDGRMVVGGLNWNGVNSEFALARYNTNGSLDTTFDTDGVVTGTIGTGDQYIYALAIQSDGKILATGYFYDGSPYDIFLVRYNADGTPDTSFGTGGKVTANHGDDDVANAVLIQPDNRIIIAGYSVIAGNSNFFLARYWR